MQSTIKSYFRRVAEGYENGNLTKVLVPILDAASKGYGMVVATVRDLYEKKTFGAKRLPVPVISVGNITWGGTGKTPLVEYLARRISERERSPLILTRGYNHDEVVQFRHHVPRAFIGVGKNRAEAAAKILKEQKIDIAVLDDGLQHWPLERDLEIVTLNALNPFGNEKLIPRGILREPLTALNRAHVIVISHANLATAEALKKIREKVQGTAPKALIVESYLEPLFFYRARNRDRVMLARLENQKVTTFSAIGAPLSFQQILMRANIKPVRNFEFVDHHVFSEKELEEIKLVSESSSADEIITTEKDFYRSASLITKILNPLILATRLRIRSGEEALLDKIFRLLANAPSKP